MFVKIDPRRRPLRPLYIGYAGAGGLTTWFDTVSYEEVPATTKYSYLSGLLEL